MAVTEMAWSAGPDAFATRVGNLTPSLICLLHAQAFSVDFSSELVPSSMSLLSFTHSKKFCRVGAPLPTA